MSGGGSGVAGHASSTKTVFADQFLAEDLPRGEPGVFATLEEPAENLRANLRTLGWDVATSFGDHLTRRCRRRLRPSGRHVRRCGRPWFGPIAAGLLEELADTAGERVLDVGCGRGAALLPLAEAAGPTGHVLGIDLAPEMVRRTASDIAGPAHVQVRAADASAPGLPSASYDVVASSLVQFFLPDPANAVRTWVDPATLLRDA